MDDMERQLRKAARASRGTFHERLFSGYWDDVMTSGRVIAKRYEKRVSRRGMRRQGRVECAVRFTEHLDDIALEMAELRRDEQLMREELDLFSDNYGDFDEDWHDRSRLIRETDEALRDDLDRIDSYEYPFDAYEPPWYDM